MAGYCSICGGLLPDENDSIEALTVGYTFDERKSYKSMVLSVKGGHVRPTDIRDLRGVLEREEDAVLAGFISIKEPNKAMRHEAGMASYGGGNYARILMITVDEILDQKQTFLAPGFMTSKVDNKQGVLTLTPSIP